MIKRGGIAYALEQCYRKQGSGFTTNNHFDPDKLLMFINDVEDYLNKDIQTRTEGSIFNIYCSDEKLFKQMIKKLEFWITEVHVPANDQEQSFIEENGHKKILCNHLPFQRYQYKVHLKEKISADVRDKLWNWMAKYDGKFRTPLRVASWLMSRKQWVTSPSIYVQDGPTLSMLLLFLGERISKVEEFIPRSVINIQSKEITCPA
jgi:hypothetical protein